MKQKFSKDVKNVFDTFPADAQKKLLQIRQLIFNAAANDSAIGTVTETLKWGEPAYLTEETGSGSTIRLGYKEKTPDSVDVYFNCQTTLIKDIKQLRPGELVCEDNRVIHISLAEPLPEDALIDCLTMALKYHYNKKARENGLL